MLLFDLMSYYGDGRITYNAVVWSEKDVNRVEKYIIGPASTLLQLSVLLTGKFPNNFPSIIQTEEEIKAVHKLNLTNKHNGLGNEYPIMKISGAFPNGGARRANF